MKKFIIAFLLSASVLVSPLAFASTIVPANQIAADNAATEIMKIFTTTRNKTGANGIRADENTAVNIIGDVIKAVMAVLGIVFLILMIYAGITWMTAQGESDKVEKARGMITTGVIGLIITLSSYAVTYFVVESLQNKILK